MEITTVRKRYSILSTVGLLLSSYLGAAEIDLKLTTSDGSSQVSVINGGATTVAGIDSTGNLTFNSALQPNGQPGTAGYILKSQGAGSPPVWISSATFFDGYMVLNQSSLQNGAVFYVSSASIDTQAILARSSGNVGIGTASPGQKLDVAGNVQFSNALMPNGLAGTSGQLLQSNGAGAAPTWASAIGGDGSALTSLSPGNISAGPLPNDVITSSIAVGAVKPLALEPGVFDTITGLGSQTQALNMNSKAINNLASPGATTDAATKIYVDTVSATAAASAAAASTTTLVNSTNTWTAQQVFVNQVSISTSLVLTGALSPNGSNGNSGDVLQSQGDGNYPIWSSSTTLLGGTAVMLRETLQSGATIYVSSASVDGQTILARSSGNVGIGTATPKTTLHVNGGFAAAVKVKTSDYTMTAADFAILGTAVAAQTDITLPPASNPGMLVFIEKTDGPGFNVRLVAAGSDSIQGSAALALAAQYEHALLLADGTATWYLISHQ
jgi:hypothetical protein